MRNLILILAVTLSLSACKKDYTCVCDFNNNGDLVNIPVANKSKSSAKSFCESYNGTFSNCKLE